MKCPTRLLFDFIGTVEWRRFSDFQGRHCFVTQGIFTRCFLEHGENAILNCALEINATERERDVFVKTELL